MGFFLQEKIPFFLVVEPSEAKFYKKITNNLLILPQDNYGYSTPARNYVWEFSLNKLKTDKHWILDDNIQQIIFYDKKRISNQHSILKQLIFAEKITDVFEKIGITGFLEGQFLIEKNKKRIISFNTHIYSFMLINNHLKFRWRLKYNEDVDLNLQTIFSGYYTLQIRLFSFKKPRTTFLKGGNTDLIYNKNDSHILKAEYLKAYWPKIVKIKRRFNRIHHIINWRNFFRVPPVKNEKLLKEIYEEYKLN